MYTDGASSASGYELGLVLEVPTGEVIRQSIRYPDMTNNEAEYEVVIVGLRLAIKYGVKRLKLRCDSQLVVNQVTETFKIKEQRLQKYQIEIYKLLSEFDECQLDQIPRAQNAEADSLAKLAATTKNIKRGDRNVVHLLNSLLDQVEEYSPKYGNMKLSPLYGETSYGGLASPKRSTTTTDPSSRERKLPSSSRKDISKGYSRRHTTLQATGKQSPPTS
nr:uncharacterized protein LOC104111670 [Nicotiana tomentosiformis]